MAGEGGNDLARLKVLAISGAPRTQSFTEKMLDLCIEGMGNSEEARKFHPHRMRLGHCIGCFTYRTRKHSGVCVQRGDFEEVLAWCKEADLVLIAVPLYAFGFPGPVKKTLDSFFSP